MSNIGIGVKTKGWTSPSTLESEIKAAFQKAREGLILLHAGNPLLNFSYSKTGKGVQIQDELSNSIYSILVKEGKEMSFAPSQEKDGEFLTSPLPLPLQKKAPRAGEFQKDSVLFTTHSPENLHENLFKLAKHEEVSLEERGSHSLYLVLGTLHWKDPESNKTLRSPLLTVSVEINRKDSHEEYSVSYSGQEIEENIALRKRLKEQYGINLPSLPEPDKLKPTEYFHQVQEAINKATSNIIEAATIYPNEITLKTFNFANYSLYRDLDPDTWPEGQKPWQHPLIREVFAGGFINEQSNSSDTKEPLSSPNQEKRHYVLRQDSSQLQCLEEIRSGQSRLIEGPPGSGKTITLVNAACEEVSKGGTVLMVFKKRAAAQAAKMWFDAVGLGPLVLDVHGKVSRASIASQLRETLSLGTPQKHPRENLTKALGALNERLNSQVTLLQKELRGSGFSLYTALTESIKLKSKRDQLISINVEPMQNWERDDFEKALAFAEKLQHFHLSNGAPAYHPLYGSRIHNESQISNNLLGKKLGVLSSLASTIAKETNEIFETLELPTNSPYSQASSLVPILKTLSRTKLKKENKELFKGINILNPDWHNKVDEIQEEIASEVRYARALDARSRSVDFELLKEVDLVAMSKIITEEENRNFILRYFGARSSYTTAIEKLKKITTAPSSFEDQHTCIQDLQLLQADQQEAQNNSATWQSRLSPELLSTQRHDINLWQDIREISDAISEFSDHISKHSQQDRLVEIFHDPKAVYSLTDKIDKIASSIKEYELLWKEVASYLDFTKEITDDFWKNKSLTEQATQLTTWSHSSSELDTLRSYNDILREAKNTPFYYIATETASAKNADSTLVDSLRFNWFNDLASYALTTDHGARRFSKESQENLINDFCKTEEDLLLANAYAIAQKHSKAMPSINTGGQSNILHQEVEKRGAHLPPRTLMEKAGRAVLKTTPIVIASPHTAATMLEPSRNQFSRVMMDEISQMPLAESLSGILRSPHYAGFGDEKQLRPTSFFGASPELSINIDGEEVSCRSALELFKAAGLPTTTLDGHYRSKRDGSISLANEMFYGGRLKIFPSSEVGKDGDGLDFHYVQNGTYDAQKGINEAEAQVVVNKVLEHIQKHPQESLGVVTCNENQMHYLTRKIEELRFNNKEVEDFMSEHPHEKFFVKNIETVQGDERDCILFSLGFAPDKNGKLSMNFGPLNQENGANRVNTMMTRYKQRMGIISSVQASNPGFKRSDSLGLAVLRELFDRAENGSSRYQIDDERKIDSFQSYIQTELEKHSLTVHPNVGPFGTGLDLAIVHPTDPDRYILGIRTDGAQYQSVSLTSDRDSIIPLSLKERNWNLYNAWSLDWFENPEERIAELVKHIDQLVHLDSTASKSSHSRAGNEIKRYRSKTDSVAVPYKKAVVDAKNLKTLSPREIKKLIERIVSVEAPINSDCLYARLREESNRRHSDKLEQKFTEGLHEALKGKKVIERDNFLYTEGITIEPRDRSELKPFLRKLSAISPEEIDALVLEVVNRSCGIAQKDITRPCFEALGFHRKPKGIDAIVTKSVSSLIESGKIILENNELVLSNSSLTS